MDENKNKFESSKKYFTISIYAICVVLICSLGIKSIVNWTETKTTFHGLFNKMSPFIIGIFIAYLIHPLVRSIDECFFHKICRIRSRKICGALSILSVYTFLLLLIFLFFLYVIPELTDNIGNLLSSFGDITATVTKWIQELEIWVEDLNPNIDLTFINDALNQFIPTLLSSIKTFLTEAIPALYQVSMAVIQWVLNLLIALVISIYVLSDKKILGKNTKRLLYALITPEKARDLLNVIKECDHIFGGYIVGKLIDSLIIGLLCFVLMSILKLPFVILISMIVGLTNMIPYFGPFIGAVPGAFIILFISPKKMIIFLIMIIALQQFDGWLLGPKILGSSTGLRPLWIIFAILLGGYIAGPIGMFLGVPLIAVISYLLDIWIKKRLNRYEVSSSEKQQELETALRDTDI